MKAYAHVAVLALFLLVAFCVSAQWLPEGDEFQINSYTTGSQDRPAVAMNPGGEFVVVWESDGQDGSGWGVRGQRFFPDGSPQGSEFPVNSHTTGDQLHPKVALTASGVFWVAWQSGNQDGDLSGVFAQRFGADGLPVGNEFQVNTTTSGNQSTPELAANAAGDFVIVWASYGQDGWGWSVQGRRFGPDGLPLGNEFQVNTYTVSHQGYPGVDADGNGGFTVVWESSLQDGSGMGVQGRSFDASGVPVGGEFQANTFTADQQDKPRVAVADGTFVVVWQSRSQDGSGFAVEGQRFAANQTHLGDEFAVNVYTTDDQGKPSISSDGGGNHAVVWESLGQSGSGAEVYVRLFAKDGTSLTDEVLVNTYLSGHQREPDVASTPNGDFVVVWTSSAGQDGSSDSVHGQRFVGPGIFHDHFGSGDTSAWSNQLP